MKKICRMFTLTLALVMIAMIFPSFNDSASASSVNVSKASGKYKVTASSLNVRTGNTSNYKRVGSLKKGKTITVNGKTSNGWYRFKYNGKNRYVSGKHLSKVKASSSKKINVSKASGKYKVTASSLNVRTGNTSNYKRVGSLKKGKTITVNGKTSNGWYRFKYNGKNRYVSGKHLSKVKASSSKKINVSKASGKYKVTASSLNVRTGNTSNYKRVGSLKKGKTITVNGKTSNGWYRFKYNGKNRYVSGKHLSKVKASSSKKINVSKASGKYKVTASSLNVRTGNTSNYKRVGSLKKGKTITVNGKTSNGWYRFKYNGKNRYVSGKHLSKVKASSSKKINVSKASGKYKVTASSLNVRTGNTSNYKRVGSLKKGKTITVNGKTSNGWYRFKYNGKNRYVSGKHLTKTTRKSSENVVDKMTKLGKSKQVILVTTKGYNTSKGKLTTYEKNKKGKWVEKIDATAHIGKNGFSDNKREGDGKSPTGKYTFGTAFGYNGNPGTKLPFKHSTKNDVWVDDPKSKYYNSWQKNNRKGKDWKSAESMMHRLYKYGVVINYNTKRTPYRGSAIFFHVGNSYTVGCTAISEANLKKVMQWIDPKKNPVIIQTPESQLNKY